ncbi:MAG TPA: hypothetical protein VGP46_14525, partial [Acidimicrobiales bacterium]|nr:hypothetical protein [Acidimicrobiales bacterium]
DVVAQVRGYYGRPWATGEADTVTKSVVCECGQPDCENEAVVTVGQAACGPVLAHADRRDLAPG